MCDVSDIFGDTETSSQELRLLHHCHRRRRRRRRRHSFAQNGTTYKQQ